MVKWWILRVLIFFHFKESSSSCNSSGPNSPNNLKQTQPAPHFHYQNGSDKKSSSSSSSISSALGIPQSSITSKNLGLTLTPIHSATSALSRPNKFIEFNDAPEVNQNSPFESAPTTETEAKSDDKTTNEIRESLRLALINNNNDNTNEPTIKSDSKEGSKLSSYDNNDYEASEHDLNQANVNFSIHFFPSYFSQLRFL